MYDKHANFSWGMCMCVCVRDRQMEKKLSKRTRITIHKNDKQNRNTIELHFRFEIDGGCAINIYEDIAESNEN